MSYDFTLHRPSEREQALREGSFESEGDPDPILEERKRQLADRLIRVNPSLSVFQLGHAEIAKFKKITEAEARRRFRYLELNGPEDGNGIQLTLCDRTIFATLPFWHSGKKAVEVLTELWSYFRVFASEGFEVHDSQLSRALDLDRDFEAVVQSYGGGVTFTRGAVKQIEREQRERD